MICVPEDVVVGRSVGELGDVVFGRRVGDSEGGILVDVGVEIVVEGFEVSVDDDGVAEKSMSR